MGRAEVFKNKIKHWNGDQFKTSADLDVWLRLTQIGNFGFLTSPLIKYREAQASTSYRLKKVRTHRHDLFLVLDMYKSELENDGLGHYSFLECKDLALRIFNGSRDQECISSFRPWKSSHLKLALSSSFHFQFYWKILAIWFYWKISSLFA
jgi:hypothetical protein